MPARGSAPDTSPAGRLEAPHHGQPLSLAPGAALDPHDVDGSAPGGPSRAPARGGPDSADNGLRGHWQGAPFVGWDGVTERAHVEGYAGGRRTRSLRLEKRRRWRRGWRRDRFVPKRIGAEPDGGWRTGGPIKVGEEWKSLHEWRRKTHEGLRQAGYIARHRWGRVDAGMRKHGLHEVPSLKYVDGPAEECEAIDPWDLAEKIAGCCGEWKAPMRWSQSAGRPLVMPMPLACGQSHVCPVCARHRSVLLAQAVRGDVRRRLDAGEAVGRLYLITLTHRAKEGESLQGALDRWMGAWHRVVRGRPGRDFRRSVRGWYLGREVTRGAEGKGRRRGRWWHAHGHLLLELDPELGDDQVEEFLEQLQARWVAATRSASLVAFNDSAWGYQETAGEDGWCKPIPSDDLTAVYQAAKYPTPTAALHPEALAEFVAVSFMRRWHQGGGAWRGVISEAEAERIASDPEWGVSASGVWGGDSPMLDELAEDEGKLRRCYEVIDGALQEVEPLTSRGGLATSYAVKWRMLDTDAGRAATDWWVARGAQVEIKQPERFEVNAEGTGGDFIPDGEPQLWIHVDARAARQVLFDGAPTTDEGGYDEEKLGTEAERAALAEAARAAVPETELRLVPRSWAEA